MGQSSTGLQCVHLSAVACDALILVSKKCCTSFLLDLACTWLGTLFVVVKSDILTVWYMSSADVLHSPWPVSADKGLQ